MERVVRHFKAEISALGCEIKMIGIIYNPLSRKGVNRHRVMDIRKILDDNNFPYKYRETECPMDGIRVAREMSETCDTIIAVGGDGTVNEVINGGLEKGVTYGILPFGSGNDASRSLHVFEKTDEELADMIMHPNPRDMDCGYALGRIYLQYVTFGIVSTVVKCYQNLKKPGKMAYPKAIFKALRIHKAKHYHVKLPDREFDCFADFIAVQNIPTCGGGLYTNPNGKDDDRQLELIIINHKSFFRLLRNAISLMSGKLYKQKNVDFIPVTEWCDVTADETETGSIDGELLDFSEFHAELYERPIKMLH